MASVTTATGLGSEFARVHPDHRPRCLPPESGRGEYHLAIQDYDEALAIFPQLGEAYAGRARSYQFLGRDLEAQQDVDRAVEFGFDRLLLEAEIEEGRNQRQ